MYVPDTHSIHTFDTQTQIASFIVEWTAVGGWPSLGSEEAADTEVVPAHEDKASNEDKGNAGGNTPWNQWGPPSAGQRQEEGRDGGVGRRPAAEGLRVHLPC